MIALSLAELAAAAGGSLVPADAEAAVAGAAADSRLVAPGDLYVAIVGARVDGHDFVDAAARAGAVAVLGQRPTSLPTIVVDDSVAGLGRLAHAVLGRLPQAAVVAVTGSSGKTSTKDLIAQVVAARGPVVAPQGSFNTEVGLPLTVLQADHETATLVLEMGARGLGHVATLCRIAQPRVSVLLNVGSAHLGEFGSREVIAQAKGEIVEALPPAGTAVLYADDPLVLAQASRTEASVLTFGEAPSAGVRVSGLTLDALARPSFTLTHAGLSASVTMQLSGEHQASNAAAAAAVGLALGMGLPQIADALSSARPRSRWRMEVGTSPSGVTVVNDSYNANPESMRAALKSLAAMGRAAGGRTWAVLGEMLELGPDSMLEHDAVGRLAVRLDVSRTLAVGEGARGIYLGASQEGSWAGEAQWVADADAAVEILRGEVRAGDVVLVKASRGAALERVAEALMQEAAG